MNEVKEILEIIPEETKKDIYNDGLKPAVVESGKALSLIPRTVKNLFSKLEMWNLKREYRVEELKNDLENKLATKKEENIVEPDMRVIIPAVQALSYSYEEDSIKTLYINLMTADMDNSTKQKVHPGFTEIIKQMDTIDVKLFTLLYKNQLIPICAINIKLPDNKGYTKALEYVLPDHFYFSYSELQIISSLNNLERLKLINIKMDENYTNKVIYDSIKSGIHIKKYQEELKEQFQLKEGVIHKTEFGTNFYEVCCK